MAAQTPEMAEEGMPLWPEVGSEDFLGFDFGGTAYEAELKKNQARAKNLSAIKCTIKTLMPLGSDTQGIRVMWLCRSWGTFYIFKGT